MEDKLVSIVIPLYNKQDYIKETVKNIIMQTYKNWELIIVDDCSTDNSYNIVKDYANKNITVIKNSKHMGAARTRNVGLAKVRGRFICYQDADDLWDEHKIEKQLKFMEEKNCAFSYTGFKYMKENGTLCSRCVHVQEKLDYKEALKNTKILANAVMFDLEKIDKSLIEMPDIAAEDIATWWKILKNGYSAYGLDEPLVYYRRTKSSASANKIKSAINRWNLYRKYEGYSMFKSLYYFIHYGFFAIIKRTC